MSWFWNSIVLQDRGSKQLNLQKHDVIPVALTGNAQAVEQRVIVIVAWVKFMKLNDFFERFDVLHFCLV